MDALTVSKTGSLSCVDIYGLSSQSFLASSSFCPAVVVVRFSILFIDLFRSYRIPFTFEFQGIIYFLNLCVSKIEVGSDISSPMIS